MTEENAREIDAAAEVADEATETAASAPAASDAPAAAAAARRKRTTLLAGLAAVAIVAVIFAAQTISFMARDLPLSTKGTFGTVGLTTQINTVDASGNEVSAHDGDRLGNETASVQRIVRAANTGNHPLWVRVRLTLTLTDANGKRHDVSDLLTCSGGDDAWQRGDDGYWYLVKPLTAGEASAALCRTIGVSGPSRFGEGTFELSAQAYGVQSEHNAMSVWDAEGWPEA